MLGGADVPMRVSDMAAPGIARGPGLGQRAQPMLGMAISMHARGMAIPGSAAPPRAKASWDIQQPPPPVSADGP